MKFAHTMIRVYDLDKSIKFYRDALGWSLARRQEHENGKFTLAFLNIPNSDAQVELTYNWPREEPYTLGDGYGHMAVHVDDMDKVIAQIQSVGHQLDRGPKTSPSGKSRIAFVKDPDGYSIELIERE